MIGIFGGTFDPVHFGHLRPALEVHQTLGLEELRLIPLNQAVHRAQPVASGEARLRMLEAAVADQPGFFVDRRELDRAGPSRTLDTLLSLRAEFGQQRPLCLLIGGDAFETFADWHQPERILKLAHLVVMRRPEASEPSDPRLHAMLARQRTAEVERLRQTPAGAIWYQHVTQLAISATAIRAALALGESPRYLLPEPVFAMIRATGMYASERSGGDFDAARADQTDDRLR
ncbi:nicotinate-nucleotide adenylyltransferase [Thiorhodovibrio frisius]|uniref:Probable nicotinate-nucleotide adenylyltransferase n=1 Tax=Thiorhodovibrio frisius TaxID=631362 RepID=H8Z2B0_9GAMM|nr:nicotinate-nucleotide adenylyltransferase [Thiorhodovibrio frisius]EIC22672.1 nicotinate/nicotinamide nucleotide adenylyltransferase [Thiorhodovibrio frisius]WPL22428.1 Nicotinate-nucleotide adenylyltransferase [Thiorhodovibrio frisius]